MADTTVSSSSNITDYKGVPLAIGKIENSRPGSPAPRDDKPLDKGKAPVHEEQYFTARFDSEVYRVQQSLGEVRAGAKLFDRKGKSYVLPANWKQMVEEHNIWLLAERCMEICKYSHTYDEQSVSIDVSQRSEDSRFCDGLLLATAEETITQTNWSTTSEVERGRLEGTVRRAQALAARTKVPWNLMRQSKASVTPTLTYVDTLYTRLANMFKSQTYHQTVAMFVTKLFNAAQIKLQERTKYNVSDYVLSFDEVWTSLGDTKKDPSGRTKFDKSGNPKRYHPSRPDFNGMDKTEVLYIKEQLDVIWSGVSDVRHYWNTITDPANYADCLQFLRKLYSAQVKSVKATKALADERVTALGLPKSTTKTAIANRKAQRVATGEYKPMFTQHELAIIGVTGRADFYRALDQYLESIGLTDKDEARTDVLGALADANATRKKLMDHVAPAT